MTRPALVVSDNSSLSLIVRLNLVNLLESLFAQVIIPPEVAREMSHSHAPAAVRSFIASPPAWLSIRAPQAPLTLPHLDPGEAAAISLAAELNATLLIDELDGRREAQARGVTVVGGIGVLERAADLGLVQDLAAVHEDIRRQGFHVSDAVLQASLARHRANRTRDPNP